MSLCYALICKPLKYVGSDIKQHASINNKNFLSPLKVQWTFSSIFVFHMVESFQDYSWIQDFEADFPLKVSLKMLNLGDYNRFSYLYTVCLKTFKIDIVNT